MDVDRLSVNDCSACNPERADGSSLTKPEVYYWDWPVMSDTPKDVTINAVDDSIGCLTQPCGTLSDTVKHRLEFSGRAGNHPKDLVGCGLLLQGFAEFLP